MSYQTLLVDKKDGIATIRFNRPEKRNAMSPQLHKDMTAVLEDLRYDDEARVLILARRRQGVLRRHGLEAVLHRTERQQARVRSHPAARAGMARPHAPLLPQADDCDDPRLLLRRRVFDRRRLRSRHRGRGHDVRSLGNQFRHVSRRHGLEVDGKPHAAARCALVRHAGSDVRRQDRAADGIHQSGGAGGAA